MAADLEFRIGAELGELKAALAAVRKDIKSVTAASTGQANPFQGVVDGAKAAEKATQRARDARGRFLGGGGGAGGGAGGTGAGGGAAGAAGGLPGLGADIVGRVGRLASGLLAVATAIKVIGEADELVTLNARLKLSIAATDDFGRAQRDLFDIAQRTRSGLGETIRLFSSISLATKDAKLGQDVLLDVVETINKAVQLSGASTQAAEAALIQLGQGLASGTLRGEELNSVLEQTPALADAIAKGMGITRGELKQLGQDGKIGAEQVIKALQAQREEVARQFAELPLTVGQSVTLVKNASLQLLGAFNDASGATAGLAGTIKKLADFLQSDDAIGGAVEFSKLWGGAFSDLARDVTDSVKIIEDATRDIMAALGADGGGFVSLLIRAFKELPTNLRTVAQIMTVTFAGMADVFIAQAEAVKEAFKSLFSDDSFLEIVKRREAKIAAIRKAVREQVDGILTDRDKAIKDAADIAAGTVFARRAASDRDDSKNGRGSGGKFKTQLTDEQKRKAEALRKAQLDAEEKLQKDSSDRVARSLEDSYQDNLIASAQYYEARARIELAAADQALEVERRRLKGTKDPAERAKTLADIEILERSKVDIAARAERDLARAKRDIDKELEQVRATDLENAGKTGDAARIRIEAQFRDLLKKLDAAGDTEGRKLIEKVINTGVARAQFDELKTQFDRTLNDLQSRQAAIADQQKSGALSPAIANQQQSEANQKALAELDALAQKMRELAVATNDPAIIEGAKRASDAVTGVARDSITGVQAALADLRASLAQMDRDFARSATGAGVDALTNFFKSITDGSKSAKEKLRDFALAFAQSMVDIAARALATFVVLSALDAIFPGLGQLAAAGASANARVKHGGGWAGQGTLRAVNPLVFANAPRLHDGSGVLGLKPGEVPAILQQGEKVQSRSEVAAEGQGGQGGGTRIVNLWDPKDLVDAMSSAAGERVILNVIEKNKGAVRQKVL